MYFDVCFQMSNYDLDEDDEDPDFNPNEDLANDPDIDEPDDDPEYDPETDQHKPKSRGRLYAHLEPVPWQALLPPSVTAAAQQPSSSSDWDWDSAHQQHVDLVQQQHNSQASFCSFQTTEEEDSQVEE